MLSADFRIICQDSHVNQIATGQDLHRYLITYATADQPQFVAIDGRGRFILVDDEKSAARFSNIAEAEEWIAATVERGESLAKHLSPR